MIKELVARMNNTEWNEFYKEHESGMDKHTYKKIDLKSIEEVNNLSPTKWMAYMNEFVRDYAWDVGIGNFRYVGKKFENCLVCRSTNTY